MSIDRTINAAAAAVALAGTVRLWDVPAWTHVATLPVSGDFVYGIAFSPDGTRIATSGRDGVVRLWDLETYEERAQLLGHTAYAYDVAFSPDGSRLVSGSGDGTVRIWETMPLRDRIRARHERHRLVNGLEPVVRRLLDEAGDVRAAVGRVRDRYPDDDRTREVALQVLLGANVGRQAAVDSGE